MAEPFDIEAMIAFEDGTLSQEEAIALFQRLIDTGIVWNLQGCYGRTAKRLIERGLCSENASDQNGDANSGGKK